MVQKSFKPNYVSTTERVENDPIVQNGLALTPAKMLELTNQGFSISAQNNRFLQAVPAAPFACFDVPLEFRRGVDPLADGYQAQQEVRSKIKNLSVSLN